MKNKELIVGIMSIMHTGNAENINELMNSYNAIQKGSTSYIFPNEGDTVSCIEFSYDMGFIYARNCKKI